MLEGNAPRAAVSARSARQAVERAVFAQPLFGPGMGFVDVGCGPGSITLGIDNGHRKSTVDFLVAEACALPFAEASVDVVFAHAVFEHLREPGVALAELRRVLKPGGTLALSTSDWSRARLRPKTANVDAALRGHYLLCRRAGGDPFAGRSIPAAVTAAGFSDVRTKTRYRTDTTYRALATYVEARLVTALETATTPDRDQLASAARSAWSWARSGDGDFAQCWTELLATR
ncbi:methyltransferase domain-containing protein [Amycolatopsis thailandensis]|uniref:SAM-dependent methyltransferase n=1 Tax=Amycolatopsis thailandensis TaxID=589330 RepID=A0A229SHN2_9PSEU|nr:methyltransferase domain-containing protein [Amycolatopsis thailandensis]OXM58375.1 SAM-dependent methyltransferase [Amycolatopsis thailandensis]